MVLLLRTMASGKGVLDDFQISGVKRVLKSLRDKQGKGITIDLIAAAFEKKEDRRVRDIGQQLFAFMSKGAYGRFFNGKNNADFRNDFIVLEPDELQGRKHLRQVLLLQPIFQIERRCTSASATARRSSSSTRPGTF